MYVCVYMYACTHAIGLSIAFNNARALLYHRALVVSPSPRRQELIWPGQCICTEGWSCTFGTGELGPMVVSWPGRLVSQDLA